MNEVKPLIIVVLSGFFLLLILIICDTVKDIQIAKYNYKQVHDSCENAQLKRQLQKANSDTTHKNCLKIK